MATSGLYGSTSTGTVAPQSGSESVGLYGNNTVFGGSYFEYLIFLDSASTPATPTGGSWSFVTNTGTPPTGWSNNPPQTPTGKVWISIALVNSKSTATLTWSTPGIFVNPAGTGTVTSVAALTLTTAGTDVSSTVSNPTIAPVITLNLPTASATNRGALSAADWTTFNSKGSGTVTSVAGTAGRVTSTGGVTPVIDLASGIATAGTTGSATLVPVVTIDTYGRVTSITTAANPQGTVTSVTGTAPVVSSGGATPAISMAAATASTNGYLTATDWTTFNSKGSGSVTSVAATVPSFLSVSGSPITNAGTLAISYSGAALPVTNGGTGVTASSGANSVVLRDANVNISANAISEGYSNVAAAGTTTTLTAASVPNYVVTGSGGQTYQLPDATTLANGVNYTFNNNQSSGTIVVKNNSGTTVTTIQSGSFVDVSLLSNSIAAGSWDVHNFAPSNVSWSTNTLDYSGSITSATWNGVAVAINRGGTGQSTASAGFNALSPITTTGDLIIGNGTSSATRLGIGSNGYVLTSNGTTASWAAATGGVTSVTGTSPVVSSGGSTPAISLAASYGDTQNPYASKTANYVLAAPNGTAGAPTFRAIVAADIPTLNQNTTGTASNVTGTVAIANGGTGQTDRQSAINALAGSVQNSRFLAGNGVNVTMRAIVAGDVPALNQDTTGTAAKATNIAGGANLQIPYNTGTDATSFIAAPTIGSTYLQYTGTGFAWAAAAGVGTVTSVAATVPSFLSISGSPITTAGTLAISYSGTALPVANGGTGVTTSTGTTNVVLSNSPTIVTPTINTITSATATALTLQSAGTTAVTITASQNVGIGTTAPGYKLVTAQAAGDLITSMQGVAKTWNIRNQADGTFGYFDDSASAWRYFYDTSNNHIWFNGASVERMRIGSAGQIGIGGANYGTSGQVLTSGGSGAAPSWTTVSGGGGITTGKAIAMSMIFGF